MTVAPDRDGVPPRLARVSEWIAEAADGAANAQPAVAARPRRRREGSGRTTDTGDR